ncbi:zinc chelation protein SecC [Pseudomonas defluvii]|uniref:zinc chelation protein SecC n=1 Tax=Pseudomonas defluvii TaxID=1876757 RepID=UPI0039058A6C
MDNFLNHPDLSEISQLAAALGMMQPSGTLRSVADRCPGFIKRLDSACPVQTAGIFAGLLLSPEFQMNCYRLEMLVHSSIAMGSGANPAPPQVLVQGYREVGEACGFLEDPPEDLFVANISSRRGNYKILNGVWESAAFYLQRIVDLTDTLPRAGDFVRIADAIHALLTVSDFIASRAGLVRNEAGIDGGQHSLSFKTAGKPSDLRALAAISPTELAKSGVSLDLLSPFIFDYAKRDQLLDQPFGNTDLEKQPLILHGDTLYVLLPTALSLAVRHHFIEALGSGDARQNFLRNLGLSFADTLEAASRYTEWVAPFRFRHDENGAYACASAKIDAGRYLNIICVMDTLTDFEEETFAGTFTPSEPAIDKLSELISTLEEHGSKQADFDSGITLVVGCGVGRGVAFELDPIQRLGWSYRFVSAPDFCTLCSTDGFTLLDLWRLAEAQSELGKMQVWLHNINGLLNLYAWADALDGHMVPHASIPEADSEARQMLVSVEQNGLWGLRQKVAMSVDAHVERYVDGSWKPVVKEGRSYFREDDRRPLYVHFSPNGFEELLGAFPSAERCWWSQVISPEQTLPSHRADRWKMVGVWLVRAAGPLERWFSQSLGVAPVLWRCVFESAPSDEEAHIQGTPEDAEQAIAVHIDAARRTIELRIGSGFDQAIYHPENIAERALVTALVQGVAKLAGQPEAPILSVVDEIVANPQARHSHIFKASKFRDYLVLSGQLSERRLIKINRFDEAFGKLGLGWTVRSQAEGGRIEGKMECQRYLNALVGQLEQELCEELRQFKRESVLTVLMNNHEAASVSRDQWHRTAAAALALRDDQAAALSAMRDHEFKLNAVFQPTRNLVEMAICESPENDGKTFGMLDASRLLAKASRLYHLGGWSDLIRWDLMKPLVMIHPLGDVQVPYDFMDTVLQNYGSATSTYRYLNSARNYSRSLKTPSTISSAGEVFEERFLSAWESEFGASLTSYLIFIEALEDKAITDQTIQFTLRFSELIELAATPEAGDAIVNNLTLSSRPSWAELPEGYDKKDIAPWRFRRRLSLLRRPLLQLSNEDDPVLLIVPGLIREGFNSIVSNYHAGSYADRHLGAAMRRYAGYARNRDGMAFNTMVADRLTELGWQVAPEIKLTKILRMPLDRDYGDVDVLAWSPTKGRVLIIECKDLQFKKTYGEIAEQLSDFRGLEIDGKRDLLRKHLDRVDVLQKHRLKALEFLKLESHARIESVVVFKHTVPMLYAAGPIREEASTFTYEELTKLDIRPSDQA